jgi:N-acyl-D-amino-acid deacylase
MLKKYLPSLLFLLILVSCGAPKTYDLIIRNGTVYDGSGKPPIQADIAVNADTIVQIGDLKNAQGKSEIDAKGLAVAPGFINMLSWATESLIVDGKSQGDIRQGVTLEVFGEGFSYGPLNEKMKEELANDQGDLKFPVEWTTLSEYLNFLETRGISWATKIASQQQKN